MAASNTKKVPTKSKDRQYRKEWEYDFPWVKKSVNGYPMCTFCSREFDCKRSRLAEHESSATHKKNASNQNKGIKLSEMKTVIVVPSDEKVKVAEMKLAGEIAKHCPIVAIDHIAETVLECSECTKKGCNNPLSQIKLHRTKCSKIINNVIL